MKSQVRVRSLPCCIHGYLLVLETVIKSDFKNLKGMNVCLTSAIKVLLYVLFELWTRCNSIMN